MSSDPTTLLVWQPNQPVEISTAKTPAEIASCARGLSPRDVNAITAAFSVGSYEMASTYVWTRAAAVLRKQIASLGMGFVGQMLGRPDIDDNSDPNTTLSEHDAVSLAEDLGMITTTEGLRLKHNLALVKHFADPDVANQEQMQPEEAVGVLRSCVASILGNPHIAPPVGFSALRNALEHESLRPTDERLTGIAQSPYFIQRTIISVLLNLLRTAVSAQLEHAIGNTNVILPSVWPNLRKPERWQVGQTYAELHAAGKKSAALGLKRALMAVQGFDFVPETLRSNTFALAAHKVMEAHFALNNFYNEKAPMEELAALGTTIPQPAFPKCMTATLCIFLGNCFGHTWAAQTATQVILGNLRKEQWGYYLNECLPFDKAILEKLTDDKPVRRWLELRSQFAFQSMTMTNKASKELVGVSTVSLVKQVASTARNAIG